MSTNQGSTILDRRQLLLLAGGAASLHWPLSATGTEDPNKIVPPPRHDAQIEYVDKDRLVIALMADPQLHMNPQSLDYASIAMDDLANVPHDFLIVLGDLVQNKPEYFEDYDRLVLKRSTRPVYSVAGNAELGAGLDAYQQCTRLPLYFTIYRRGIRFIFLSVTAVTGSKTHICNLGEVQLRFLKNELASGLESTTVIAFHAPVFETTWRSEDRDALPFPGSMYLKESAEMRELFASYPNIKLYVHGHLHHAYGVRDSFGRGEYSFQDGVLHVSVGATANNRGSSVLYIAKNQIVAKVRDHSKQRWRDASEYAFAVNTTLQP